jgi:hypothetical protein
LFRGRALHVLFTPFSEFSNSSTKIEAPADYELRVATKNEDDHGEREASELWLHTGIPVGETSTEAPHSYSQLQDADTMASSVTRKDLVYLYRRLLRSCETYPSKNRSRIYQSIREDFRENKNLEPGSEFTRKQIHVAYKGLEQLHQFDGRSNPIFTVQLEQNPFPKPDNYEDKRTQRVEQMLEEHENK